MKGFEILWSVPDGEKLVAMTMYQDVLVIATDQNIYRYDGQKDTVELVEITTKEKP